MSRGCNLPKVKNRKGRAMGGIMMGIRTGLKVRGMKIDVEKEGVVWGKVERGSDI